MRKDVRMAREPRLAAALAGLAVLAGGCSSSGPSTGSSSASRPPSASSDPVQAYLNAVNNLCDELLPKIVKVTNGGNVDVPVKQFLATWPAHERLLNSFDASLARIPVPPGAEQKAAALSAYIRFADRLDAARVDAARRGQAAYDQEMKVEANAENDPTIAARTAAGFDQSCDAR